MQIKIESDGKERNHFITIYGAPGENSFVDNSLQIKDADDTIWKINALGMSYKMSPADLLYLCELINHLTECRSDIVRDLLTIKIKEHKSQGKV